MPYIKQSYRQELAPEINNLIEAIVNQIDLNAIMHVSGILNYCITSVTLGVIKKLEERTGESLKRYWMIALISGVFSNVQSEFYRKYAAPFEDEKIKENGDVF